MDGEFNSSWPTWPFVLRTFASTSNQFVLSFGVLIAFLSPKQSKIEESSSESMAKKWKAQKHEEPNL